MRVPKRLTITAVGVTAVLTGVAGPAGACAGLVTESGNVKVLRTATLAAYHDGVEHYVTAFTFSGGGAEFGSLVPLPGLPTKVERGGDWTLQRLQQEVAPPAPTATGAAASGSADSARAEEVQHVRIDALDVTVLKGGGAAVGEWAREHGFRLSPDAPEVLDFYGDRSPYFLAAVFDAQAADERGQQTGEGTPVHLTIPTDNPWVPLRILTLGQAAENTVDADIFVLSDRRPTFLPVASGLALERSEEASPQLLDDLRSDKGMEWVPARAHLSYLRLSQTAGQVRYDLAADVSGRAQPSPVAAGLQPPAPRVDSQATTTVAPTTTTPTTVADTVPRQSPSIDRQHVALPSTPAVDVRPDRSRRPWLPVGVALVLVPLAALTAERLRRRQTRSGVDE